jgi:hypothetical protein
MVPCFSTRTNGEDQSRAVGERLDVDAGEAVEVLAERPSGSVDRNPIQNLSKVIKKGVTQLMLPRCEDRVRMTGAFWNVVMFDELALLTSSMRAHQEVIHAMTDPMERSMRFLLW